MNQQKVSKPNVPPSEKKEHYIYFHATREPFTLTVCMKRRSKSLFLDCWLSNWNFPLDLLSVLESQQIPWVEKATTILGHHSFVEITAIHSWISRNKSSIAATICSIAWWVEYAMQFHMSEVIWKQQFKDVCNPQGKLLPGLKISYESKACYGNFSIEVEICSFWRATLRRTSREIKDHRESENHSTSCKSWLFSFFWGWNCVAGWRWRATRSFSLAGRGLRYCFTSTFGSSSKISSWFITIGESSVPELRDKHYNFKEEFYRRDFFQPKLKMEEQILYHSNNKFNALMVEYFLQFHLSEGFWKQQFKALANPQKNFFAYLWHYKSEPHYVYAKFSKKKANFSLKPIAEDNNTDSD